MSTTAIVAEIVIVGLEAEAWLGLFVLTIFGRGWVDLGTLSDFSAVVVVVMIATAYALGVVVDRVADSMFKAIAKTAGGAWLNRHFGRRSHDWTLPARVREMRYLVIRDADQSGAFLDYQRSRIRVARGTALNLAIAALALAAYLGRYGEPWQAICATGLLFVLLAVTVAASERIHAAWLAGLSDVYRMTAEVADSSDTVVAAVTYAQTTVGPCFLLVKTRGGQRWTFPKGHVKKGEAERTAVARELSEEAGVAGSPQAEPFTAYEYPATRPGESPTDVVRAYLVEVDRPVKPEPAERKRKPKWVRPDEARKKLVKRRRGDPTADEHLRVLEDALQRIGKDQSHRGD